MAAPVVKQIVAIPVGTTTTWTLPTWTAALTPGSTILIFFALNDQGAAQTITAPAGFTALGVGAVTRNDGSSNPQITSIVWKKENQTASNTTAGYTITVGTPSLSGWAYAMEVTGVPTSSTLENVNTNTGTSTNPTSATIASTDHGANADLAVAFFANQNGVSTQGTPTNGFTQLVQSAIGGTGSTTLSAGIYTNTLGTGVITTTAAVTLTGGTGGNRPWTAWSLALIPKAVAVAPILVNPPVITGTAQQGQTLTVSGDTWNPSTVTRTYQWQRSVPNTRPADAPPAITRPDMTGAVDVAVGAASPPYNFTTDKFTAPPGGWDNAVNYNLILPTNRVYQGSVLIQGGKNVTMIGGTIAPGLTSTGDDPQEGARSSGTTAIMIKGGAANRIVHIEGVKVDSALSPRSPLCDTRWAADNTITGDVPIEIDAFELNGTSATVQILNCRLVNLDGGNPGVNSHRHADTIQDFGIKELRIENCTFRSHYNILQARREGNPVGNKIGRIRMYNVNAKGNSTNPVKTPQQTYAAMSLGSQNPTANTTDNSAAYNTWLSGSCWFVNVYSDFATTGRTVLDWIQPGNQMTGNAASVKATLSADGTQVYWPAWKTTTFPPPDETDGTDGKVYGGVTPGPPASGDFCPDALAGFGYVAPPNVGAWTNISSANASTYVLTASDVGNQVRCTVTASSGGLSTPATTTATSVVAPLVYSLTVTNPPSTPPTVTGPKGTVYTLSGTMQGYDSVTVNGVAAVIPVAGTWRYDATLSGSTTTVTNSYSIVASGGGAAGTTTIARSVKFAMTDTDPPVLTLSAPSIDAGVSNATTSQTVTGVATDFGSGIKTVKVNGVTVTVAGDGSFSTSVALAVGSNTITVVATDLFNLTKTITRSIVRAGVGGGDATPPVFQATDPPVDGSVDGPVGTTINVTAVASDNVAVASVTLNGVALSGANGTGLQPSDTLFPSDTLVPADTSAGTYTGVYALADGDNVLTFIATDTTGNTATVTRTIHLNAPPDLTPPTLNVPTTTASVTGVIGATYTLTGTASDEAGGSGLAGVTVAGVSAIVAVDGSWSSTVALGHFGANSFDIVATDNAGNSTTIPATITLVQRVIADTTPPTINVTNPGTTTVSVPAGTTGYLIQGVVTDTESGVASVRVNGSLVSVDSADATWSYNAQLGLPVNTYVVTAADRAGNVASVTITITVIDDPGTISISSDLQDITIRLYQAGIG